MNTPSTAPAKQDRGMRALRLAVLLTFIAMGLALVLLIKETAYTFVVFSFVGPPLVLVAVLLLGWVVWTELRAKKVF